MGRAVLAIVSVLIGWVLVELGARAILGPPPRPSERIVLFTLPNWQLWGGSLRYAPRQEIRTLALAGDVVEYDATFNTNNLGFIDSKDYIRLPPEDRDRRYFFVGDSFTAGFHGGEPWVPQLRVLARRRDYRVEVYNGGVGATGFSQFAQLLESVGAELDFGRIVVPFITHDVYRSDWRPHQQNGLIFICPTVETVVDCVQNRPTQMLVLSDATLVSKRAPEWVRQRNVQFAPRSLLDRFREGTFAGTLWRRSQAPKPLVPKRGIPMRIGDVLASFHVGVAGRPVTFLHIPERDETRSGRYREDVSGAIRAAGYEYASLLDACDFRLGDYFEVDPHFNARGYDKLRTCIGRELGLL
jgi:hypothetical protein